MSETSRILVLYQEFPTFVFDVTLDGEHSMNFTVHNGVAEPVDASGESLGVEFSDGWGSWQKDPPEVPFARGFIRWDGCVNMTFPGQEAVMLHFCGPEPEPELGLMMKALYMLASQMIPAWYEETVSHDGLVFRPFDSLVTGGDQSGDQMVTRLDGQDSSD